MFKNTKRKFSGWMPSKDLSTAVSLCEKFNQGRTYEIFWEYSNLTPETLKAREGKCWLYYEDGELRGFGLGRHRHRGFLRMGGAFIFEEVWVPCEGLSSELGEPRTTDIKRIYEFKSLIDSMNFRSSTVLRAATDNQFMHMVARALRARWINGLVIAERNLNKKIRFSNLTGYRLRMFEEGDQFYMSKTHEKAFKEKCRPEIYRAWAMAANCRTVIATYHTVPVGFIIAEKRGYGFLGDFTIAIEPVHQGKGIGSILLKTAFNVFIDMGVRRVIADYLMLNASAYRLYEKHKFKPKRIYNYFLYEQ